jgi:hypothetical protein
MLMRAYDLYGAWAMGLTRGGRAWLGAGCAVVTQVPNHQPLLNHTHTPPPHRCVDLPCVPDPTRTLSSTPQSMDTVGRGRSRGAARQYVAVPALGVLVGGESTPQPPTTLRTHAPTVMCDHHASPAPYACCPPLSYVFRLRGEGGKGVLPTNMWPLLPWVCGWAFCCGRHS